MKIIKLGAAVLFALASFTSCQKQLDFGTGDVSVGTLQKSLTGDCLPVTVNGFYKVDSVLTNENYVDVKVDVSAEGTFNVKSDTLNGYSFSKTGSVGIGTNTIRLYASGKAVTAGNNIFTIKYGASVCSFMIIVSGGTTPTSNLDYIPQTSYSNWSVRTVGGAPDDTSYVHVLPNPIVLNGNTYKIFETVNSINYPGVHLDSFYYRKSGSKYYHIYDDNYYFDGGFNTEGLILDSALAVGANWIILLGNDTWGGQPAIGSIKATILAKGVTATIAGNSYNNIIKVEYIFRHNISGAGDVDYDRWELWFAKGIGEIYAKYNLIPLTTISEEEVTRTQVY
jgi:hypothetical protein